MRRALWRWLDRFAWSIIQVGAGAVFITRWSPTTLPGWLAIYGATGVGLLGGPTPVVGVGLTLALALALWRWGPPEGIFLWTTLVGAALVGWPALAGIGHLSQEAPGWCLDDLSRSMVALVGLSTPMVAYLGYHSVSRDRGVYWGGMLAIWAALVGVFIVDNLLIFYTLFEALAFPMFVHIGRFGSSSSRRRAAFRFFIYTLLGSLTTLPAIVAMYTLAGGLDHSTLIAHQWTPTESILLGGSLSVPFLVKLPVVPLHLWLVEAHVEAPAPSSMVLAGLLLKTGGYGYLRWVVQPFPGGASWWSTGWLTLAGVGALSSSVAALVQTDLKRMLAYSSVSHMSMCGAALFVGTPNGAAAGVYTMLAHGFGSAGLFGVVGALYDRYHTRGVHEFGGLSRGAPWLAGLAFILCLANLGFPLTGNFIGEFATLGELVRLDLWMALPSGVATFSGLVSTMWAYNRVFFGLVHNRAHRVEDLHPAELAGLTLCVVWVVALGLFGGQYWAATEVCYTDLFGRHRG